MTEESLISGCQQNQANCQRLLFERYSGRMMALCLRYTHDRYEAEDFLQEGFIRVFAHIGQYRGDGNFEGWMRKVFARVIIRELKKKKISFQDLDAFLQKEPFVEASAVANMSEAEIQKLIQSMPEGYKTVFNLYVLEGFSHEEIAQMLGIQASTSRVQFMKAKKHLMGLLAKMTRQTKTWATFLT